MISHNYKEFLHPEQGEKTRSLPWVIACRPKMLLDLTCLHIHGERGHRAEQKRGDSKLHLLGCWMDYKDIPRSMMFEQ
jgi:hypothetical protein